MPRRKNATSDSNSVNPELLAQLFPDDNHNPGFHFDITSNPAFGRLIASVTGLGGMVTLYSSSTDHSFSISIRFSERKRSYSLSEGDATDVVIEQLCNHYHGVYAKTVGKLPPSQRPK